MDILEPVIPAARKRGVKVYTWAEDVFRSDVPGIEQARAVDFHGRPAQATLCFNNPNYFNFLLGLHNDFTARLSRDKTVCRQRCRHGHTDLARDRSGHPD